MATRFRPTSPHLEIWRFTLTMTLSILHRIFGVGLYLGTLLVILWLGAAALGQDALSAVNGFFDFWLIQLCLFIYTFVLFQHMAGGIKHFVWDAGAGFGPVAREILTAGTLVFSFVVTVALWAVFVWF